MLKFEHNHIKNNGAKCEKLQCQSKAFGIRTEMMKHNEQSWKKRNQSHSCELFLTP